MKKTVPYYRQMKKGMAAVPREKKTKKKRRMKKITEYSQSGSKPVLKKGVSVNQVARKLYEYEQNGISPKEVEILMDRVKSLERRIKRLEEW